MANTEGTMGLYDHRECMGGALSSTNSERRCLDYIPPPTQIPMEDDENLLEPDPDEGGKYDILDHELAITEIEGKFRVNNNVQKVQRVVKKRSRGHEKKSTKSALKTRRKEVKDEGLGLHDSPEDVKRTRYNTPPSQFEAALLELDNLKSHESALAAREHREMGTYFSNQLTLSAETMSAFNGQGRTTGVSSNEGSPEARFYQLPTPRLEAASEAIAFDPFITRGLVPELENSCADHIEAAHFGSEKEDDFRVKLEPGLGDDEMPDLGLNLLDRMMGANEGQAMPLVPVKRPRGRPRKHPLPTPGEALKNLGKGRSKTGCITCRKRKKKCDEAKPHCLNCEKNAVICEGYQPLSTWRSGREKATSEEMERRSGSSTQSPASAMASIYHGSLGISLPPVIHGIETECDRLFFSHYCYRLSRRLTVEGPEYNAFKEQLLPMAVQHIGLMHSVLALSASSIDWKTDYGIQLLAKYPDVSIRDIDDRTVHHNDASFLEIGRGMDLQRDQEARGEPPDLDIIKARFGQMLCYVLKSSAEGNTEGAHRLHLGAYEKLVKESPPDESPFMNFIHEYFQYHICFDQLIGPPDAYPVLSEEEFWMRPTVEMPITPSPPITDTAKNEHMFSAHSGGLFGLQQDIYNSFMSRIGKIRHDIRQRMENRLEPHVNFAALHAAAALDAEIKSWPDASPPPERQDDETGIQRQRREKAEAFSRTGTLYKKMLWVYLWRTIYPPSTSCSTTLARCTEGGEEERGKEQAKALSYDTRIRDAVDWAIRVLQSFGEDDPCQTMLLSPAFLIGCAAFEAEQRKAIRWVVRNVGEYTTLRNADLALRVLEEVWRRMDGRGDEGKDGKEGAELRNSRGERDGGRESSWDWQGIARDLGLDFLVA